MRTSVKILVVIALVFSASYAQAQTSFGIKGGMNIANVTISSGSFSVTPDSKIGINLGLVSETLLAKDFYLQSGLIYTTKGFIVKNPENDDQKMTMSTNNIEIPINALYKLNVGSVKLLGFGGPYIGYSISGKTKVGNESEDIKFSGDNKEMNAFDFGFNIGAGIEIQNLQISAQYGVGLSNLIAESDEEEGKMKNKVFGLSVAYFFGR